MCIHSILSSRRHDVMSVTISPTLYTSHLHAFVMLTRVDLYLFFSLWRNYFFFQDQLNHHPLWFSWSPWQNIASSLGPGLWGYFLFLYTSLRLGIRDCFLMHLFPVLNCKSLESRKSLGWWGSSRLMRQKGELCPSKGN